MHFSEMPSDAHQFFCIFKFRCVHAKSQIIPSILFMMMAITTTSISVRTAVRITKLGMNQPETVRGV